MGNYLPFKIKVKIDEKKTKEISIKGNYLIHRVELLISGIQSKIDKKYLQIYKDNQLLESNKTVSSYHLTSSDILTIKSSRQGEFLIYFCELITQIDKYVVKEEKIYDIYNTLDRLFSCRYKMGI